MPDTNLKASPKNLIATTDPTREDYENYDTDDNVE